MTSKIPVSVLHVEDDPDDAHAIEGQLGEDNNNLHSYDITRATTMAAAQARLRSQRYNAILLDLNLPDGQGMDNIRALKTLNPDIPVIVITGMDDEKTALQALREGAQEYIVKSHSDSHVIQRIIQSSIFRKRVEIELLKKAHFDPLTGLPNRMSFEKMAQPMLQRAKRWDRKEALMFIDLNKFKQINDEHGHEAGNTVLKEVASRIQTTLRTSDLIARYAGDEFVVYMDSGSKSPVTEAMCKHVSEKILDVMKRPIDVDGKQLTVGLSIGIAIYPDAGQTFDVLLKNADKAMYTAKASSEKKYFIFGEDEKKKAFAQALQDSLQDSSAGEHASAAKRLVLIIDDSLPDRLICKKMLESMAGHFEILEAGTVREALRLMEKQSPHCILLDYNLPDISGLDFLKKIHSGEQSLDAAIVVITGRKDRDTAIEVMKFGARDYVVKGQVDDDRFIQIVSSAIDKNMMEKELASYQRELERSNRDLSDFAHTVAHDLKAPMRRTLNFCELLEGKSKAIVDEESRNYIKRMSVNAARMQALVDNLLTYAQIMTSAEKKETTNLSMIANEVVDELEAWLKEHKATVIVNELPSLPVYPVGMHQLFTNLVTNAVKYSRPEVNPVIKIRALAKEKECVISIEDNGMGLDTKDLAQIFAPFKRLHSADQIEGTGLGLSICRKVAEKHEGKIWAESKKGEGSTFLFSLPV